MSPTLQDGQAKGGYEDFRIQERLVPEFLRVSLVASTGKSWNDFFRVIFLP